ncbi:DUF2752 domain-containing protein [Mycobacterium sp. DL592]|uniref:DUF2752 domain-containing protein n=1 Tax=Mycobacterium sp. DL592 TaxID=2675524 RepID=UPI0014205C92|nr:DUF2752 domain-containing protein [Mycobacterium sp. DL592]
MEPNAPHRHGTRLYTALGTGLLAAGALTYVGLADPHRPGFLFPTCPFKLLTGWNCPACGGLRMTHDLLNGNLTAAVVDNVFLLVGLPILALWTIWRIRQGRRAFTVPVIVVIAVAAIAWTITRNMPGFPLVPTLLNQ